MSLLNSELLQFEWNFTVLFKFSNATSANLGVIRHLIRHISFKGMAPEIELT